MRSEDQQAAITYAEKQPDHSGTWMHRNPPLTRAETARSWAPAGVLVFTFTKNLDAHRRELEQLWGGPLCVAIGEVTTTVLSGIVAHATDLLRREGRAHGMLCESFALSADRSDGPLRVSVSALAWDSAQLSDWLSQQLAGFPVHVTSPLEPEPAP